MSKFSYAIYNGVVLRKSGFVSSRSLHIIRLINLIIHADILEAKVFKFANTVGVSAPFILQKQILCILSIRKFCHVSYLLFFKYENDFINISTC